MLMITFYLSFIILNTQTCFREERRREEARSLNRGWHSDIEDPFLLFGSHRIIPKVASRREDVDSSEEADDSKDASVSPLGE